LPEDIETGGIDAVCQDCAKKYGEGKPLTAEDRVRLIEIPLNARLEEVIGGIDERLVEPSDRIRIRRGILAQADRNLLYIDEINLLGDDIIDSILDASAQGSYSVRRGPVSATYRARFVLIGSMNPEEGKLRPQILDRFGLRIIVRGLDKQDERLEAYRRVQAYLVNPHNLSALYVNEILTATREIQSAKKLLPQVKIPDKVSKPAIKIVQKMGIESLRAEITWFEAARAYTAADGRTRVLPEDLRVVAPMALRMRKSLFMKDFIQSQVVEEEEIRDQLLAMEKRLPREQSKIK
jgi:magnesium chelatase subunit I